MKHSRPNFCLEEELIVMFHKLFEKKTSKIFREPVDSRILTDYYEKIKNPIDLTTMVKKLKAAEYTYPKELVEDFKMMIDNCKRYNVLQIDIVKTAEKFQKSIETEWGNFEKEIKKKGIYIDNPILINEETLKKMEALEEKNNNRKTVNLQMNLLEQDRKVHPELKVLPPLPPELFVHRNQDDLPASLAYQPQKYLGLKFTEKSEIMRFIVKKDAINQAFEALSVRKLNKYRKILTKRLVWIDQKIMKKCLERKRFKKMTTPGFLTNYLDEGKIASNLQLRKVQIYMRMITAWIEQYPNILSYKMKNKFIDNCKSIKKALFRVLKYRKVSKNMKIQVPLMEEQEEEKSGGEPMPGLVNLPSSAMIEETKEHEDESRKYDNQYKHFKKILSKDQSETIKKYTKIMIKHEGGEFTIEDWNYETNIPKPKTRNPGFAKSQQNSDMMAKVLMIKKKKQQKQQDIKFLQDYREKTSMEHLKPYMEKLQISWNDIRYKKIFKEQELSLVY